MKNLSLFIVLVSVAWNLQSQEPLRLGLNFPFRNPELTSIENFMEHIGQSGAQLYRQLTYADVIWSQIEPQNNQWNFSQRDSVFKGYPQFKYAANLYSFTVNDIGYQVPWKACETPGCGWNARNDSIETKEYLKTCIDRYSSTVKYWDLGNEAEDGKFPAGIPIIDFVKFFKYNYRWIKEINPNVKVILPATVGTYGVPLQKKYEWFRTIFQLGAGNDCDIIGYHDYNSWWTMPVHIDSIMKIKNSFGLKDKPLWLSESSCSSIHTSISPGYSSVNEQAADVWRRSCLAWSKGVEMFIWHGCWSSEVPSVWAEFGLLDHHGLKKKSYHSFKLLADNIIHFDDVKLLSQGITSDNNDDPNGGNGVWVVEFNVKGENKYVMWSRNNVSYTLRPDQRTKFRITNVVPKTISTDGETATFQIDSVYVSANASYTFSLTSLPVFVEEITDLTSVNYQENDHPTFEVFPNPARETLGIRNHADKAERYLISDISGKLMEELEIEPNQVRRIDLRSWENGIYFIRAKDQLKTQKIVVIR
jgi:hypothetical protein